MFRCTIIIPHYNSPRSLDKLLDSVGVHNDIQVLVVDDRSTEGLDELKNCRNKYSDTVKFLSNQRENKGAGSARNVGLENAEGEWLLFADSDDYFLDGWYEKISAYFDSDYDLVYFTPTSYNLNTHKTGERSGYLAYICYSYLQGDKYSEEYLRYTFPVPWSKLVRRSVVTENNIAFSEVMYSNDVMFSTKTGYYAKRVTVSPESIYCVTRGNESLTTKKNENSFWIRTNVLCEQYDFLKKGGKQRFLEVSCLRNLWFIYRKFGRQYIKKYTKLYAGHKMPMISLQKLNPVVIKRNLLKKKFVKEQIH